MIKHKRTWKMFGIFLGGVAALAGGTVALVVYVHPAAPALWALPFVWYALYLLNKSDGHGT